MGQWGWDTCVDEKKQEKKTSKRKEKETYGRKESKKNNSIIKWYYNIFIIFHNKS